MTNDPNDSGLTPDERAALAELAPSAALITPEELTHLGYLSARAPLSEEIEKQVLLKIWLEELLTLEQTRALWAAYNYQRSL